jgi:hypothetical protein
MNLCDYYVKEVLRNPCHVKHIYDGKAYEWWKVEVSYYYDNGELKTKELTFDTEKEASEVKEGFHFTA